MIKDLILKFLKPNVYVVHEVPFMGKIMEAKSNYRFDADLASIILEDDERVALHNVYLTKFFAQRELLKHAIPFQDVNVDIVKRIEAKGIPMTNYQRTQVMEDGPVSEFYLDLINKGLLQDEVE